MALTLYSNPGNKNTGKAKIAAQYAGVAIDVPAGFEFGKTNKTPEFLKLNPHGKVGRRPGHIKPHLDMLHRFARSYRSVCDENLRSAMRRFNGNLARCRMLSSSLPCQVTVDCNANDVHISSPLPPFSSYWAHFATNRLACRPWQASCSGRSSTPVRAVGADAGDGPGWCVGEQCHRSLHRAAVRQRLVGQHPP